MIKGVWSYEKRGLLSECYILASKISSQRSNRDISLILPQRGMLRRKSRTSHINLRICCASSSIGI